MKQDFVAKLQRRESRGPLTAGIGGIIGLFAFFALPQISALGLVSFTGAGVANLVGYIPGRNLGWVVLVIWLLPLIFAASAGVGAYSFFGPRKLQEGATPLIASGAAGVLILIVELIVINSQLGQYAGLVSFSIGYWLSILCMAAVAVGGYFLRTDS